MDLGDKNNRRFFLLFILDKQYFFFFFALWLFAFIERTDKKKI